MRHVIFCNKHKSACVFIKAMYYAGAMHSVNAGERIATMEKECINKCSIRVSCCRMLKLYLCSINVDKLKNLLT